MEYGLPAYVFLIISELFHDSREHIKKLLIIFQTSKQNAFVKNKTKQKQNLLSKENFPLNKLTKLLYVKKREAN